MSWQDASTATHKIVRAYVKRLRNRLDDDDAAQAPLGAGRAHAAAMPARRLSDARPSGAATAEHPADQNDRCSRSACVVNGRLRHTGEDRGGAGAYQRAVNCGRDIGRLPYKGR